MRILYLHQYFRLPEQGGGTRSYEFARRWAAAGHEVTMVTSDTRSGSDAALPPVVDGVRVEWLRVPYHQTMGIGARLRAFVDFLARAAVRSRKLGPFDVVVATSTPLTIAVPGAIAKRSHRAPLLFEVRDLWPEVPIALGALGFAPMRWAARALEWFAYRSADHVVALSPGMAAGVASHRGTRCGVSVIPNSSDRDVFDVGPAPGRAFRAHRPHLGASGHILLYTGTFGAVNEATWLVDVTAELVERGVDVHLLLIGFGSQEAEIRAASQRYGLLGSRVHIESYVPKHQIAAALSAASLAFSTVADIPELDHNSANKVFDAFAAGVPVAINHEGWLADLLRTTGAGLVLDRDPTSAAAATAAFLADEPKRAEAAAAASAQGVHFDRDRHSREYLEILEELTQRRAVVVRDLVSG